MLKYNHKKIPSLAAGSFPRVTSRYRGLSGKNGRPIIDTIQGIAVNASKIGHKFSVPKIKNRSICVASNSSFATSKTFIGER